MKICVHHKLVIAVLTRNEHCPPHVHVGTARWDARFQFSFWHNGVRLWDVTPSENEPNAPLLEELRQVIRQPAHLRRARECWWTSRRTICLENQWWDPVRQQVVSPRERSASALCIQSSHFDAQVYRTFLQLAGTRSPVEIEL